MRNRQSAGEWWAVFAILLAFGFFINRNIEMTNSKEVAVVAVNKVKRAIEKCETEKKYNNSAEKIALYIISSGREITNLLLQKFFIM